MKQIVLILYLLLFGSLSVAQIIIDLEEFNLPAATYINGEEGNGGFSSGDIFLRNFYNPQFMSWSGWAISTMKDTSTPGFSNQYSAITGQGANESLHYAVTYAFGNNNILVQSEEGAKSVLGMYITNSTYAYLSMKEGDAFSKKFGGASGDDPDYFLLTIKGYNNGTVAADSVDFYLADYRFTNNSLDYIVNDWTWVDLSSLGPIDSLSFRLRSTDIGQFGMNTPAYFCMDHIVLRSPTSVTSSTQNASLKVYPNPVTDFVTVSLSGNDAFYGTLLDVNGDPMWTKKISDGTQFSVQQLPSGIYTLLVQDKSGEKALQIVKQ